MYRTHNVCQSTVCVIGETSGQQEAVCSCVGGTTHYMWIYNCVGGTPNPCLVQGSSVVTPETDHSYVRPSAKTLLCVLS